MKNEPVTSTDDAKQLDLKSHSMAQAKVRDLLRLFPEARTEDSKVDYERLRLAMGAAIDSGKERYGLMWPGKADCFRTIQAPSLGTLRPVPEESTAWDSTQNLILEGDNLEVLKLLQKSYLGKVKMIYIDPPYNTGNDFIYPDNYTESLQTYLEYTTQVDSEGKKFGTNADTDGRFHSKWLSMMYPRLYLARNLLKEDGLLFASISDDEAHNLRHILDEVFGPENFIGCIVWDSTKSVTNTALISVSHTYNLVYARSKAYFVTNRPHFRLPEDGSGFGNPDSDPRGPWKADPFQVGGERPNQMYEITNPRTGEKYRPNPGNSWKNEYEVFTRLLAENRIVFGTSGEAGPQRKRFLTEAEDRGRVTTTLWDDVGTTTNGTRALKELLGPGVFSNPKPVDLIERFIQLGTHDPSGAIVMDFFAGSGTTAEAVMRVNRADGGTRRFLLVQLPEPLNPQDKEQKAAADFCDSIGKPRTIAEICKERVRRVVKELDTEDKSELSVSGERSRPDRGFRVYKLGESNFKVWDAESPKDAASLQKRLSDHVRHIREGRTEDDLLAEILLKSGFPLATPSETLNLGGKKVHSVSHGALLICLDRELNLDTIRAMAERKPERVVCLDEGFAGNDQLKANAVQTFKTKGVSSFKTI